mmetsp:Transcript_7452/g.6682  ORF Transcript_7452/g.6682 Transcript_7452/m.6682 type:complete len:229 (+) Transcript_7452:60-746(+)
MSVEDLITSDTKDVNDIIQDFESISLIKQQSGKSVLINVLDEIQRGFEAPYVRMPVRRKLKTILKACEHPESIFKREFIPSDELLIRCREIKNDMGEAFQKSTAKIASTTRTKVINFVIDIRPSLINLLSPKVLSRLSPPRLETTVEIIKKVIPSDVTYSARFFPDGKSIVYISQENIVDKIKNEISVLMNTQNVRGCVDVAYVENGKNYSDEKLERQFVSGCPIDEY